MTYYVELPPVTVVFERWEYVNYRAELPLVGIYEIIDEMGRVLYVGKSTKIANRLADHIRSATFSHEINRIRVRQVDDLQALDIYETHAINVYKPIYNRDKVYRPSPEVLAQLKYDYMAACDNVEMYRDQIEFLTEEEPCTLRDIDLEIAKGSYREALHIRKYLRQKLGRKP